MTQIINEAGLRLLKSFEKCELTAYLDESGILTVGWGHRVLPDEHINLGDTISDAQADALLARDLTTAERIVSEHIRVPLNDNQFSACVCFAFNAGSAPFVGRFAELLNNKDFANAAIDFTHWDHVRAHGILSVSVGLERRCIAEKELFES